MAKSTDETVILRRLVSRQKFSLLTEERTLDFPEAVIALLNQQEAAPTNQGSVTNTMRAIW